MPATALLVLGTPVVWFVLGSAADAACPADRPNCHRLKQTDVSNALHRAAPGQEARRPKYERVDGDIETLWQRPLAEPVKGLVFMAHGCNHQATDFFRQRGPDGYELPGCAASNFGACLGLPEERVMVHEARSRGYLVLAVSGGTGVQSCWNMHRDPERVGKAIGHVLSVEGLPADTPVLATGASSGGAFMGALAESGVLGSRLRCILPQISSIHGQDAIRIPTLFVHMPRDHRTAARVQQSIAFLRAGGNRHVEELPVAPEPVRENFARYWPEAEAAKLVSALEAAGLLDAEGHLRVDPRRRAWVKAVHAVKPEEDSLARYESPIAEALKVAWAFHAFTSKYAKQMLDFCEGQPLDAKLTKGAGAGHN